MRGGEGRGGLQSKIYSIGQKIKGGIASLALDKKRNGLNENSLGFLANRLKFFSAKEEIRTKE